MKKNIFFERTKEIFIYSVIVLIIFFLLRAWMNTKYANYNAVSYFLNVLWDDFVYKIDELSSGTPRCWILITRQENTNDLFMWDIKELQKDIMWDNDLDAWLCAKMVIKNIEELIQNQSFKDKIKVMIESESEKSWAFSGCKSYVDWVWFENIQSDCIERYLTYFFELKNPIRYYLWF